ncbi:hypothetical protein B0H34DRAFT_393927 [Crassisporium funariophilum]|nr:hypothetical protein B0H34DRAFT_393927 [Crassisporium funariophilum]
MDTNTTVQEITTETTQSNSMSPQTTLSSLPSFMAPQYADSSVSAQTTQVTQTGQDWAPPSPSLTRAGTLPSLSGFSSQFTQPPSLISPTSVAAQSTKITHTVQNLAPARTFIAIQATTKDGAPISALIKTPTSYEEARASAKRVFKLRNNSFFHRIKLQCRMASPQHPKGGPWMRIDAEIWNDLLQHKDFLELGVIGATGKAYST